MTPFRASGAEYVAVWEQVEREVLARVARDVASLVRSEAGLPDDVTDDGLAFTGVSRVPRDPAVRRLLPDAHQDDPEAAAEFRHLTQTDIAAAKLSRLEGFAATLDPADLDGGRVVVPRDEAEAFAGALTDVRLVLAERLALDDDAAVEALHHEVMVGVGLRDGDLDVGADDDVDAEHATDDAGMDAEQRRYWGGVFVAAGFAQESLTEAMLDDLRSG